MQANDRQAKREQLIDELRSLLSRFVDDRHGLMDEQERMMMTTRPKSIAHMQRLAQIAVSLDEVEARIARCRQLPEQLHADPQPTHTQPRPTTAPQPSHATTH